MAVAKSIEVDISVSGDVESKAKIDAIDAKAVELKKVFGDEYALKISTAAASSKLQVFRGEFKSVADAVTKAQDVQVLTAKAQKALDDIRVRADTLRATFPKMTAQIDTAEATRKLALLAAEAKLDAAAVDKAFGGAGGGRGGILGALFGGGASAAGPAAGAGAQAAAGAAPLLANPYAAGGAAAAAVGVTLSGALGIVPALAAATLGVGAFGALALPTFTAVTGAVSALSKDTAAYDAATTKAAKNAALAKIKADWAALDPGQQQAVKGVQALQASFGKLATALEPLTLKVLNAGLKVANDLLPALKPLADAGGKAILGLLAQFDKFAQSPGFKAFIANMARLAGPAITALGEGFGKVAVSLGKLLVAMESPDALRILNGLFDALAGTINVISWAFVHLTPVVIKVFHDIAVAFDDWRHNVANDVHQVSDYIDTIRVTWVTVGHALEATWNNIAAKFDAFRHRTAVVFDGLRGDIARIWDAIRSGAVTAWDTVWRNTVTRVQNGIADVVRWFTGLPGKITSALSSLGTTLLNIGKGAMGSLLSGFASAATGILSWLGNFAKSVLNAIGSHFGIHFSEPSTSTVFYKVGQQVMQGMINGIKSKTSALVTSAAAVANAVTGQFSGSGALGGDAAANKALARKMFPWPASQWPAFDLLEMHEAGYNRFARNPTSGAYGIPQAYPESKLPFAAQAAGGSHAGAQLSWMFNYISQVYGTPAAAWAQYFHHAGGVGSYALGTNWALPGWAMVGERGPEMVRFRGGEQVIPSGGGGGGGQDQLVAEMRRQNALLEQLIGVAGAIPARTGQHVGAAIGGAAHDASFRSRYH